MMRAFDIDKALGSLSRPTPSSFIRIFSTFAGIMIILVAIFNGLSSIPSGLIESNVAMTKIITNRLVVGSFRSRHNNPSLDWNRNNIWWNASEQLV